MSPITAVTPPPARPRTEILSSSEYQSRTEFNFLFQSDCRINLVDRIGENYILKATLDEFDEYRMKKNMSDEMKYKEKVGEPAPSPCYQNSSNFSQVECFTALASIAHKINERDADMRSHIVLSMFKVSCGRGNILLNCMNQGINFDNFQCVFEF